MYLQQAQPRALRPLLTVRGHASAIGVGLFFLAHVPLALAMKQYASLATIHAVASVAIGIAVALLDRRSVRVAYAAAYICGAEVLWRMTHAQVYWEYGKYATALILLVSILRSGRFTSPVLPFVYFALLLPSAIVTSASVAPAKAQELLSFNLSGPFALMVGAWFFSRMKISAPQIRQLFLILIGPVLGIAAIAFVGMNTASQIRFSNNSNLAASGGFGPNQVSAALGLAAVLSFFLLLSGRSGIVLRALLVCVMILTSVQCALTFSRGGLYNAGAGILFASFFLMKDARSSIRLLLVAGTLFLAVQFVLLPKLDEMTGGALLNRFKNTEMTGRVEIAERELEIWAENPVLGVGPGMAMFYYSNTAHTEFTRLLAEHGLFGMAALLLMFVMAAKNLRRPTTSKCKAVMALLIGWSFFFILSSAMRIVAPSFLLSLTFASFLPAAVSRYWVGQTRPSVFSNPKLRDMFPPRGSVAPSESGIT
jgi:O-antigen ligase